MSDQHVSDFKRGRRIKDPDAIARFRLEHLGEPCDDCELRPGLAVHHGKFRSQLGDDVESNFVWLCRVCHDARHGITRGSVI